MCSIQSYNFLKFRIEYKITLRSSQSHSNSMHELTTICSIQSYNFLESSQPHSNSMHELTTICSIQFYNFLEFRIKNKIIIQKIKFKNFKDNTILFLLDSKNDKILSYNFLKFRIENIIIIKKIRFKDSKN